MSDEACASNDIDPKDAQIRRLETELEYFTKSGIIEVAVRNPSVNEYMHHWERRAEKAEGQVAAQRALLDECERVFEKIADRESRLPDGYWFYTVATRMLAKLRARDKADE